MKDLDFPKDSACGPECFASSIDGVRVQLFRSEPAFAQQVWDHIQRDHRSGGTLYSWVNCLDDVIKHVVAESSSETKEIDYLITVAAKVIGSVHVHSISTSQLQAEVGYAIEKGEEGNGYVGESLELVLKEMKRIGLKKAIIRCDEANHRSVRVALRNKFLLEARIVDDKIAKGLVRNSVVFGRSFK